MDEAPAPTRPYKVICISFYEDDLKRLDALVRQMKALGWTNMSRSRLLREAIRQVKIAQVPKPR